MRVLFLDVDGVLNRHGFHPGESVGLRWREIEAWLAMQAIADDAFVIVDDGFDMGPYTARFVRTSPLNGLDHEAATAILKLFGLAP